MGILRRWLEYDAAKNGLRALVSPDEYEVAMHYARGCGRWRADVVRYIAVAFCLGFTVQWACDLHTQGVPRGDLLGLARELHR